MKLLKNITVGIDFSDTSHAALAEAARIAVWNSAQLHVCHVAPADELEDMQWPDTLPPGFLMEKARAKVRDFVVENLRMHPKIEFTVAGGNPFIGLLETVRDTKSDLLVLGSYGLGGREDKVGSIASKCIRKAPVPVLLVRPGQSSAFRKVVACTDFSDTAKRACATAAEVANQDGADLDIIHVYSPPWAAPTYLIYEVPEVWDDNYRETYTKTIDTTLQGECRDLEIHYPDLKVNRHLVRADLLADGLAGYLKDSGADLVVLGTQGRTGLRSILLGTTAEKLVHESPCSVLAIKPEEFHYEVS